MVHLPFLKKKKSERFVEVSQSDIESWAQSRESQMVEEEISPDHSAFVPYGAHWTISKETLNESSPVLDVAEPNRRHTSGNDGKITRETHVVKRRQRSITPPVTGVEEYKSSLSPPQFLHRSSSASQHFSISAPIEHSPSRSKKPTTKTKSLRSPKLPRFPTSPKPASIFLLRSRNPFGDAEPSGSTPKLPERHDPLLECMIHMRDLSVEQTPIYVKSDGLRSTSEVKGEFVTDKGLAQARKQLIDTEPSAEGSGIVPAVLPAKTKDEPPVLTSHKRLTATWINQSAIGSQVGEVVFPVEDYLKVEIPHISIDAETIWPA